MMHFNTNTESGLTIIELMISIVLGLLVTAATIQIFLTSQRSISSQFASSNIQNDGLFALETLSKNLRMSNYGARKGTLGVHGLNDDTPIGGVVMTAVSPTKLNANLMVLTNSPDALLARSISGKSNIDGLKSDQLTVQKKVERNEFDCEGNEVVATLAAPVYLVQKYSVKEKQPNSNKLALYCKAAIYHEVEEEVKDKNSKDYGKKIKVFKYKKLKPDSSAATTLVGDGEIQIDNVDYFGYLLGIDTAADSGASPQNARVGYVTLANYMDPAKFPSPKPAVRSIRIAVIVNSKVKTESGADNADKKFDFLNQVQKSLKADVITGSKLQREVFETTILLRNGRG